jgi:hypothetical protein
MSPLGDAFAMACAEAGRDMTKNANEKVKAQTATKAANVVTRESTPLPIIFHTSTVDLMLISHSLMSDPA